MDSSDEEFINIEINVKKIGRPKKIKPEILDEEQVEKRKPGRPKIDKPIEEKIPKKIGRPRKTPSIETTEPKEKKKPGRKPNPDALTKAIDYYRNYYHINVKKEIECPHCLKKFCSPNSLRSHQVSDKKCIFKRVLLELQQNPEKINSFVGLDFSNNEIKIAS